MRINEILASIDAQIAELRRIISETKNTIEALETLKERKEMIVSLGGGVLVKTEYTGVILVDVGGGIVLEKSLEETMERLKKRITKAESEIERLQKEKEKILKEVRDQK